MKLDPPPLPGELEMIYGMQTIEQNGKEIDLVKVASQVEGKK